MSRFFRGFPGGPNLEFSENFWWFTSEQNICQFSSYLDQIFKIAFLIVFNSAYWILSHFRGVPGGLNLEFSAKNPKIFFALQARFLHPTSLFLVCTLQIKFFWGSFNDFEKFPFLGSKTANFLTKNMHFQLKSVFLVEKQYFCFKNKIGAVWQK